jgi:ADP-ribose pyrophosphatase YjhB (NUDIX family)
MILLLQRAADNLYELPGGNWEETNDTIPDTAAREVEESTALVMSAVVRI